EARTGVLGAHVAQHAAGIGVVTAAVERGGVSLILLLDAPAGAATGHDRADARRGRIGVDGGVAVNEQPAPTPWPAGVRGLAARPNERRQRAREDDRLERRAVRDEAAVTTHVQHALALA